MQTKRTSQLRLTWKEYPVGVEVINGAKKRDFTFSLQGGKLGDEKETIATAHVTLDHSNNVAHVSVSKCPESDEDSFDYHPQANRIIRLMHANLAKAIMNKVENVSAWKVAAKGALAKGHFNDLDLSSEEENPLEDYHFQTNG